MAQTVEASDSAAAEARRENGLPLIPTRTLDFTTSEGTWMSLDVSPDGGTIVFELLGDLYTLPVQGGQATRITSGQAYDMQPRYSPDGSRIVFVSDRDGSENVWVADADGTDAEQLTDGERESYMSPVWTPDGDYVISGKGSQLWLYHVDGGSGLQITGQREEGGPTPASHQGAAFGPDERYVWLNLRGNLGGGFPLETELPGMAGLDPAEADRSSARLVGAYQIGQLDRETGQVRVRTHELEGAFRPMPSPDGRWLVYATRYDARSALKMLDLQTGEDRWLRMDVARDDHQGGGARDRDVYPNSAFLPDGSALITNWGGKLWRVAIPSGDATEIPFTARVEQELGPLVQFQYPIDDSVLVVTQIRGARPSPDGRRLAFTALDRLYLADLPAGRGGPGGAEATTPTVTNLQRLTTSPDVEHAPVWSPDGRWLAYVTWNDSAGGDIWRVRSDGSAAPERLTPTSAFFDKLTWSADGSRLVAVRGSRMHRMRLLEDFGFHTGAAELEYVWLPAGGGEPQRIMWVGSGATQQGRNAPHVGPDPDRIYVWTGSDGLISVRYDGTDIRPVVKVTAPSTGGQGGPPTPDEVVLSPDGTRALVRANRNVFMITVPRVGGDAPTVSAASSSSMPTWRLTDVGGDFVGWRPDGAVAHWSIGRSYFQYDLALADSLRADSVAAARAAASAPEEPDEADDAAADEDDDDAPAYAPYRADVDLRVAKDKPRGVVALRGARLLTMRDDTNEVIERGDIVIRDNRIAAIGPSGSVDIPAGAEVIDASGTTILPGLVDIHAHTWVAWGVHRNQVSQFLAQLAYGVTTQRDPQTSSEDVLTFSDRMEVGELIGPRLYSTGPGVFSNDNIQSLDEARDVLRRYADHFNTQTIKQYLAGDRKVRQWVITAARELGLTPTTEGGSNFTMNLTLMQDGYAGLEHSLPISPFFGDVTELGRFSGLVYTPTLVVSYGGPSGRQHFLTHEPIDTQRLQFVTPHDELDKWKSTQWYRQDQYVYPLHAEQLVKWMDAGGQLGLGSHGEVQGVGTHWELWMMAAGGMDEHDALRMATRHSAEAIGLGGDIGSLEVGKLADLQILDSNPLTDLRNTTDLRYVMKNGRLYEARTLTEVWPRQRALPTQWWWRLEPPDVPVPGR
ncbi:MAG: amidohydrolase family protein [Longimicrobiales bacterium]